MCIRDSCNPINPKFMADISDAYESAYTIMLNLNKTWIQTVSYTHLDVYKRQRYATVMSASLLMMQPFSTANSGNLLSSVAVFITFFMLFCF